MPVLRRIKQWLGATDTPEPAPGRDAPAQVTVTVGRSEPQAAPSPQPGDHFQQAFDIATRGIEWSEEARAQVRSALEGVMTQGAWQAKKALEPVWPDAFRWPEAEAHLASTQERVKPSDFAELLHLQVSRIEHALHRQMQMRELMAEARQRGERRYVMFRGDAVSEGRTLCGKPEKVAMPIAEVPQDYLAPCTVVGCDCKLFTLDETQAKRYTSA